MIDPRAPALTWTPEQVAQFNALYRMHPTVRTCVDFRAGDDVITFVVPRPMVGILDRATRTRGRRGDR